MDTTSTLGQGRAPGLYDEQLQRQQHEKALFRGTARPQEEGLLARRLDRRDPRPEGGER
jgi:hypothetical protein